ncbi:MAG: glycosyltransferase family 2 protein [Sphingobacteriaceae bacterium]|nr:MAG: glycosyltransferase family 2 protein [Sphingobacteriaceae bacterium]
MVEPLVSIIIPVYNSEKYLTETINSAINQTWANKEIIIVDDGSTDNSLAIAKQFENDRVKILNQQNKGASAARNRGIAEAQGAYIQFLDADDLLSTDKIAAQLAVINGADNLVALCSTIHFKDTDNIYQMQVEREWYASDSNNTVDFLIKLYSNDLTFKGYGGMVQPNAWLTPKAIIDKAGWWNEQLTVDDDGEYFCRVLLAANGVKFSHEGINYYRKFDKLGSLSSQKTEQAYQSKLTASDLKYEYLKTRYDNEVLKKIFSRFYWEIGVAAFPQTIKISNIALKKAKEFGYNGPKYHAGKASNFLVKILGWRILRIISFIRYGF